MIRFACPGCSATFTVDDEKAGKTGKCPKCQTQFVIPSAEAGIAPAPPAEAPPPLPGAHTPGSPAAVEIEPCPKCQTRLSVGAADVGLDVECPYCKTVFKAVKGGPRPPAPPPAPGGGEVPRSKRRADDEDDDRPRSRRRPDDEDDDRPSRRRRRGDDDDDDEDDRRPSRRRRRRYDEESKRTMAGALAIVFGVLLGIPVHKFMLGYTTTGVIQLVLNWATCGMASVIQIVEGVIYLTKSDEEFVETYQVNEKHWF